MVRMREAMDNKELLDYKEDEDKGLDSVGAKAADQVANK